MPLGDWLALQRGTAAPASGTEASSTTHDFVELLKLLLPLIALGAPSSPIVPR